MKPPAVSKPKTTALPITEWVDRDAVQALQDQAQAARAINEPVERLVALHAAAQKITATLAQATRDGVTTPLSTEGAVALTALHQSFKQKDALVTVGVALGGTVCLGLVCAGLGFGLIPLVIAGGIGLPLLQVATTASEDLLKDNLDEKLREINGTARELETLSASLLTAAKELENSLTFDEARHSSHLDAALDLSPVLEARFNKEAARKLLKAAAQEPATAPDTPPAIPPKRPSSAL